MMLPPLLPSLRATVSAQLPPRLPCGLWRPDGAALPPIKRLCGADADTDADADVRDAKQSLELLRSAATVPLLQSQPPSDSARKASPLAKKRKSVSSDDEARDDDGDTEDGDSEDRRQLKKARRKEQCRVNQANYRKRKRVYEQQLTDCIRGLQHDIQQLVMQRDYVAHASARGHTRASQPPPPPPQGQDPEHLIVALYQQLQSHTARPGVVYRHEPSLYDLQWQQFESLDHFAHHWGAVKAGVDAFELTVTASERLQAGDQVVIGVTGELRVRFRRPRDAADAHDWQCMAFSCPVRQRFVYELGTGAISLITSEVDWMTGVSQSLPGSPMRVLTVLEALRGDGAVSRDHGAWSN
ncbi:hypothetical protein P43SY_006499 [Pythium insidiosum]|uniref:BZIP domain-containing protein n=1 Tax=Pythium insidiosum TaxID=114742 RepID=A0AAD5M0C5_PYTIN|nr:hypothetical protein P43SY_006499 [Pythium insidiosum]